MRIALILEQMDVLRGGMETYTAQVAEALARRGHRPTILCQSAAWGAEGIEVRRLGRRGGFRFRRLRNFVEAVQREIRQCGYDVTHAMLPVPGADIYQPHGGTIPASIQAHLRRRPALGGAMSRLARRFNLVRGRRAHLERQVVADGRTVCLAVSAMVARQFADFYGRRENVRVVFNGVDVPDADEGLRGQWRSQMRERIGAAEGEIVFITVATNFELKGVREEIAAFARWRNGPAGRRAGARLVVVGRQEPRAYQRLARRAGVGQWVTFLPPTREVFPWYSAADGCILLSWYDSCSLVVLEAARWQLPWITTAFNGAAEGLDPGAGIVVGSPRDTDAIVAAMDQIADSSRRSAMVAACRKMADSLSMDRHVDELLKIYRELAGERGGQ